MRWAALAATFWAKPKFSKFLSLKNISFESWADVGGFWVEFRWIRIVFPEKKRKSKKPNTPKKSEKKIDHFLPLDAVCAPWGYENPDRGEILHILVVRELRGVGKKEKKRNSTLPEIRPVLKIQSPYEKGKERGRWPRRR